MIYDVLMIALLLMPVIASQWIARFGFCYRSKHPKQQESSQRFPILR